MCHLIFIIIFVWLISMILRPIVEAIADYYIMEFSGVPGEIRDAIAYLKDRWRRMRSWLSSSNPQTDSLQDYPQRRGSGGDLGR